MTTIKESIERKIELAIRWENENPGLIWCSKEYDEKAPKFYTEKKMLESAVYRNLSRRAILVLQDFFAKREMGIIKKNRKKVWVILNNGKIAYPYSEAEEKGIRRDQFRDAIDELQLKGFLDITHQGTGGRKPANGSSDWTTYWLDDRWEQYGTEDFKPPRNPRKRDKRKDRGWAKYHAKKKQI